MLELQNGMGTLETIQAVSENVKRILPYDPTPLLLGIYTREMKAYVHTKTSTKMFITTLFIIPKSWKEL